MATPLLSVRWLLHQRALALQEVIPATRDFEIVQTSELPDPSQFLLPHSIVLTIGISFQNNEHQFGEYMSRLADAGVVALGFGTGLAFQSIPQALIDAAKHHHIGLFEVPHDTPFISIQTVVNKELANRQIRQQEQLVASQRRANQAAITGGVEKLIEQLTTDLQAAVAIKDNDQRLITHAKYGALDATKPAEDVFVINHKMLTFGDRFHQLITVSDTPLDSAQRNLIKHCASLADLMLQRPHSLRNARSELNALALSMLLGFAGEASQIEKIFAGIADSHGHVRPVVIHSNIDRHINQAIETIDKNLVVHTRELCSIHLDKYTALFLFRGSRDVENIIELFGEYAAKIRICIGGSRPWKSVDQELIRSLVTSAKSIPLGEHLGPQGNTLAWLRGSAVMEALDQRAHETLGRLENHDRQHDTHLRLTLATHLQRGAQVTATAEALGIHRHTVRSRLERISEICEVDLENPVTRAELLLVTVTRKPVTDESRHLGAHQDDGL